MYLGYKTSVLYYNSSLPSWVGDCWKVKLGNENKQLTKTFKTGVLGMVWQEGLKEHGHQRVSSNVSVSRSVQACEKYCTSLLFNPQIINYLSVQIVKKKSRCSQCWLLRCTWWQVPHWSRTVAGDQSYMMISSYSINMTIIVRFRSLDICTTRWNKWSSQPVLRESSPAMMASASPWNKGKCVKNISKYN